MYVSKYKPMGPLGLDEGNVKQKRNGSENLRERLPRISSGHDAN